MFPKEYYSIKSIALKCITPNTVYNCAFINLNSVTGQQVWVGVTVCFSVEVQVLSKMERNKPHQSSSKYSFTFIYWVRQYLTCPTSPSLMKRRIHFKSLWFQFIADIILHFWTIIIHCTRLCSCLQTSPYLVNKTVWLHKYNGLSSGIMQKITQAQDGTGNSSLLKDWVWFCQCTALPLKIMLVPWPESSMWRSSNRRGSVYYFLSSKLILTRAER